MLDIELIALLEEDLNEYLQEQEQKETDKHKTHSSSVAYAATELQTAKPEIGAKIKSSAQNEPHTASHDPQVGPAPELESATSNQEMKLFGLEEQLRILIAENPEYLDDGKKNSTTATQCEEAGLQCEYTQNESSVDVQTECNLGANQKRNLCEADLDFNKPQHPHSQSNIIPTLFPTDELFPRTHSEVAGQPPRIQEPEALYALSEVGHDFTTMLGGSPGRKRQHNALNQEPSSPQEATEDAESSPTIGKSEIADSQEDYENEGNVVKSKRIKPNPPTVSKQHFSETNAGKPSRRVNFYKERLGRFLTIGSPDKAYAHENHDNAHHSRDLHEGKNAPKKREPWGASKRYQSSASSLPDYGYSTSPALEDLVADPLLLRAPIDHDFVPVKPPKFSKMPSVLNSNSFRPRNTLRNDPHNRPNSNPPLIHPGKHARDGFDLSKGDSSGRPEHITKRQKTEEYRIRTETHKKVIHLESAPSAKRDASSTTSIHSQTQNGLSRSSQSMNGTSVPEYDTVERGLKTKNTRRKSTGQASAQGPKLDGRLQFERHEGFKPMTFKYGEAVSGYHGENPEDPIEVVSPEVEVSSKKRIQAHVRLPHKGSAHLQPPKQQNETGRRPSTKAHHHTPTVSPHFAPNEISQQRRNSARSDSVIEVAQNESVEKTNRRQNGASLGKRVSSVFDRRPRTSDCSEDELSMDADRQTADILLAESKRINSSSTANNTKKGHDTDSDYSEGDLMNANMITNTIPKRRRQNPDEARFQVIQLFTSRHSWLSQGRDKPWRLIVDLKNGVLNFFDDKLLRVEDLDLCSTRFHQIHRNNENGKLQIHKPADRSIRGAHQICLELANADESEDFCNSVCRLSRPPVGMRIVARSNLDKIFEACRDTLDKQRAKKTQDPEDVQAAKRSHEASISAKLDKAQEVKRGGNRIIDQFEKHDDYTGGTKRHLQERSAGSYSTGMDFEDAPRPTKVARVDDSNPHATRSRNANSFLAPRQAPTRSPSPERWTELHPEWAKQYNWQGSIIYPKQGKNKVTVDKQDIERLDEGQFLNDNLLSFYLLKLEQDLAQRDPALSKRVYFFNSFFYLNLTSPVKGKKGINYKAVERWTARVDLLSYDYIIVPVNENSHWYVAIICNAPKLVNPEPEVVEILQSPIMNSSSRKARPDADGANKSSPISLPKIPATEGSDNAVDKSMKEMSLTGKTNRVSSVADLQNDTPILNTMKKEDDSLQEVIAPEAATIATDGTAKPVAPAAPAKRGKRKSSTPAPRKYPPKDPRIITLDSLGLSHSATCTNLRDYLAAEAKAKRGVDISPPRTLGMTAVNIPSQKNYCDCGLFLLSYVEAFLKKPDDFTADLLGRVHMEIEYDFEKAPKMRDQIRDLLFELQKEQVGEQAAKNLQNKRAIKGKELLQTHGEDDFPASAEASSSEASKSTRPSAEPERPHSSKSSVKKEFIGTESARGGRESSKDPIRSEPETRDSTPGAADVEGREPDAKGAEQETKPVPANAPQRVSQEDLNLEEKDCRNSLKRNSSEDPIGHISSSDCIQEEFFRSSANPNSSGRAARRPTGRHVAQRGTSRNNALEVEDDSQHNDHHDLQRPPDVESVSPQMQRHLVSPSPELVEQRPSVRKRASTPHPRFLNAVSPEVDDGLSESPEVHSPLRSNGRTCDSSPLEPAAKPPSTKSASNIANVANDGEMLFGQGDVSAPQLLDIPSSPATPVMSPSKKRVVSKNPQKENSRMETFLRASWTARQRSLELVEGRDSSDKAIIGGQRNGRRPTFGR